MKGITRSEHEKRIETFKKRSFKMNDSGLSNKIDVEIDHLSSFYDTYQWHIKELQKVLKQYHSKSARLKRMCNDRSKVGK